MGFKIVPAHKKTNVVWPLTAGARGWELGVLISRYESGLRKLLTTRKGSYPFLPAFGLEMLEALRGQILTGDRADALRAEIELVVPRWLPDLDVVDVDVRPTEPNSERVQVTVIWSLPEGAPQDVARPSLQAEPIATSVLV